MAYFNLYNDNRKIKMKEEQLNLKTIAQIFGFFPDSVFLIDERNDAVETADETGIFYLEKSVKYKVYGESIITPVLPPPVLKVPGTPTISNSARAPPKGFSIKTKWPARPASASKELEWTKTIEVSQVTNGEMKKLSNFPVALNEASANIIHVSQQLSSEVFGGKSVILLDNDNLPIPDTVASRGKIAL